MRTSVGSIPRFSTVLCPVDFSEQAADALAVAAALATRNNGSLDVLFVNDPLLVAAAAAAYNRETLGAATGAELRRFVTTTLSRSAVARLAPRCLTALGTPAREILKQVDDGRYDVVVVGTRGLNGARKLLLGSTTTTLLRRATVPVLAVPPLPAPASRRRGSRVAFPGRTLVAAIELGPHAADDVARAGEVARAFGTALVLLHVVARSPLPEWVPADLDAHLHADAAKATRMLDTLRDRLTGVRTSVDVRIGHPADEIAAATAEHRAGLIVMALRARGGLVDGPAGACTYEVLCHGVAPVLALPETRPARRRRR